MQVHQYIYTRLSRHESPWDKAGFQSAFLPAGLLDRSVAIELESYIHRPEGEAFASKHVVHWMEIASELYLLLYFLDDMPGAYDEYNRGGIFMCQGFLIPPALWRKYRRPLFLAQELEPYRYHSIEALLDSPYVDDEAGTIAPIELEDEDLPPVTHSANPLSEVERRLLHVLLRLATDDPEGPRQLVLKGAAWQVEKVLDRVFTYLPEQLRTALSLDPGFDGGKMHFSPVKVFGYHENEPVTGAPVRLDLETGQFDTGEFGPEVLEAPNAYARWLGDCMAGELEWRYLDDMAALAHSLENGGTVPPGLPFDACFAAANAELVRTAFRAGLDHRWPEIWKELLVTENPPEVCLKALVDNYTAPALASMLEHAILRRSIRPADVPDAPPAAICAEGSPGLKSLVAMWGADPLDAAAVRALSPDARLDFLRIAAGSRLAEPPEFVDLVLAEKPALRNLLREPAVMQRLERHFRATLWPQLQPLSRSLLDQLLEKEPPETFGEGQPDWLKVLENYLATLGIPQHDIQTAAGLRQQISPDKLVNYPFLQACLHPSGNVAGRMGGDYKKRAACLRVLVHGHGHQERALREFGFERDEIEDVAPGAGGLMGKVRRLFGN